MKKISIHFTANYLINPTNPLTIDLIGAGGTGSHVLHHLARMNGALTELRHPGFFVRVFDDDTVSVSNINRQRYSQAEVGYNKATTLVTRINRFYGTNWKAIQSTYNLESFKRTPSEFGANITMSCVDTIPARFEIATILKKMKRRLKNRYNNPLYWMDFGNDKHTGQVILSTVLPVKQPNSKKYNPVENLPFITDEFKDELNALKPTEKNTPSCSLAAALQQQDLFINTAVAEAGCGLLWNLIRNGMTCIKGVYLNVKTYHFHPMPIK